jgi:chromosome segregation ATPase
MAEDLTAADFKAAITLIRKLEAERSVLANAGQVLRVLANAGPAYQEYLAKIEVAKNDLLSANAEIEKANRTRAEINALARDERGRYVAEKNENDRKLAADKKTVEDEITGLRGQIETLKREKAEALSGLNAQIDTAQKTLSGISAKIDRIKTLAG